MSMAYPPPIHPETPDIHWKAFSFSGKRRGTTTSYSRPSLPSTRRFGFESSSFRLGSVGHIDFLRGHLLLPHYTRAPGDYVTRFRAANIPFADPRWTPENRPVVDGAKPASGEAVPSVSVVPRSMLIGKRRVAAVWACPRGYPDMAAIARGASEGQRAMRHGSGEGRDPVHGAVRSLCSRVRQLRGPQVTT